MMIKLENVEVLGWKAAIRGMRNPLESWNNSDSIFSCKDCKGCYYEQKGNTEVFEAEDRIITDIWCDYTSLKLGENDLALMKKLSKAGSDHAKYLRMINVTCDVTAPLYWWKEYDTYKVGTVANSCSTMHKIHAKEFSLRDFSWKQLNVDSLLVLEVIINRLNQCRSKYIETKDKEYWWQMIQLLPTSYNQKRTIQLNYQVLKNIYFARKNHKLDEWRVFCDWIRNLPYAKQIITLEK